MVYKQLEWTVDKRPLNPCSKLDPNFDEKYEVCMKGILPRANVGRFKLSGGQFKLGAFEKEYETKEGASYLSGCMGDSGSGQWVTTDQDTGDERRAALVAVYHGRKVSGSSVKINGKTITSVCGSSLTFGSGDLLSQGPTSTITTHQTKLEFIAMTLGY